MCLEREVIVGRANVQRLCHRIRTLGDFRDDSSVDGRHPRHRARRHPGVGKGHAEVVHSLIARNKQDWQEGFLSVLKKDADPSVRGVALKLIYGSDFPYRGVRRYQPAQLVGGNMYRLWPRDDFPMFRKFRHFLFRKGPCSSGLLL
jgi:hypothetical protein